MLPSERRAGAARRGCGARVGGDILTDGPGFDVTAGCADGYQGGATAVACASSGPYSSTYIGNEEKAVRRDKPSSRLSWLLAYRHLLLLS